MNRPPPDPHEESAGSRHIADAVLAPAAIVVLETAPHGGIPAVVHHRRGDDVRIELLTSAASTTLSPGTAAVIEAVSGGTQLRFPATIASLAAFPAVDLRVANPRISTEPTHAARIALAFPVRWESIAAVPGVIAARVRARADAAADGARASGDPAEVALLALARMMARLDARFDRVLASRGRHPPTAPANGAPADDPHDVLVFSLAKMMLTRLDEKFDRLLAAMRDPGVLGRPPVEGDDGATAIGVAAPHLVMLHALTRVMDSLSEKFERVVAAIDRPGDAVRLESAWGLAVGENGVTLGLATPVASGALLDLELRLPLFPALPLVAFARVDTVTEHPDDVPERRWRATATFVALPEADRDLLVQLVLRKQREQLRARHEHAPRS